MPSADAQPLDLVEHRRVPQVVVVAVDAARADDADRRLAREHGADLHRRGVGAQQPAVSRKSVSCASRAGWSSGKLSEREVVVGRPRSRDPRRRCSRAPRKISSISRVTSVTGWSEPVARPAAGQGDVDPLRARGAPPRSLAASSASRAASAASTRCLQTVERLCRRRACRRLRASAPASSRSRPLLRAHPGDAQRLPRRRGRRPRRSRPRLRRRGDRSSSAERDRRRAGVVPSRAPSASGLGAWRPRPGPPSRAPGWRGRPGRRTASGRRAAARSRQHLAVEHRSRRAFRPEMKPVVGEAVQARGRVDADDPERAELALLLRGGRGGVTCRPCRPPAWPCGRRST